MSSQLLTYIFVGSSFALYIGIAIWSRANSTNEFYVAGKGVNPPMVWQQQQTGCRLHLSFPWQD